MRGWRHGPSIGTKRLSASCGATLWGFADPNLARARTIDDLIRLRAVSSSIDFLAREHKVLNFVYVPFPIMLVPLVRFFSLKPKPSADQRAALKVRARAAQFTCACTNRRNSLIATKAAFARRIEHVIALGRRRQRILKRAYKMRDDPRDIVADIPL